MKVISFIFLVLFPFWCFAGAVIRRAPAEAPPPPPPQASEVESSAVAEPPAFSPPERLIPPPTEPEAVVPAVVESGQKLAATVPVTLTEGDGVEAPPSFVFGAEVGETLQELLFRWCERANCTLQWEAEGDLAPFTTSTVFESDFEVSIDALFAALRQQRAPVKAIFYRSNRVLHVFGEGS